MKIHEIKLNRANRYLFPDGARVELEHVATLHDGTLRVTAESGRQSSLVGLVDIGEEREVPRVFVVEGRSISQVMLWGGLHAARLTSDSLLHQECELNRTVRTAEYWSMEFHLSDSRVIVCYEGGVILLNDMLSVVWHRHKLINDIVQHVDSDAVHLIRDETKRWSISVPDGVSIDQPGAPDPCP